MVRRVRATAASAVLLAVAHGYLAWLQYDDTAYLALLSGVAALLGIIAAARLWWANCMESRFVTAAIALGALLGHLLVAAVGLPGQRQALPPQAIDVIIVALSCAVLLLLVITRPPPRAPPQEQRHTC